MGDALRDLLDVIRAIGRLGKQVHFHLHDGHPLIPGLADHFSFLTRLPDPLQLPGPPITEHDVWAKWPGFHRVRSHRGMPPQGVSFTLEIHQVEGRLPLADAAPLFPHWRDTTNAERMNYWLSVLGDNAMLVSQRMAELSGSAERLPA